MDVKTSLKHMAMKPIRGYKKYVSSRNELRLECKFTPSCSMYTAESIKEYGVLEGSIRGGLRILRCNQHSEGGYDPVPKKGETFPTDFEIYEHPPVESHSCTHTVDVEDTAKTEETDESSLFKKALHKASIIAMSATCSVIGGLTGLLAGLIVGVTAGSKIGLNAGRGTLEEMEKLLLDKYVPPRYQEDQKKSLKPLNEVIGSFGASTHDFIAETLHCPALAKIVGTPVGLVTGAVIAGIAGGGTALVMGGRLGSIMGKNFMKDKLGLLPQIAGEEEVLKHYEI